MQTDLGDLMGLGTTGTAGLMGMGRAWGGRNPVFWTRTLADLLRLEARTLELATELLEVGVVFLGIWYFVVLTGLLLCMFESK